MRLLASADIDRCDAVFHQSAATGLFASCVLLSAAVATGAAGWFGILPAPVAGISSVTLLAFTGVSFVTGRRSLKSTNWLMAIDDDRLLVNLRSYLNEATDADVNVLELRPEEISGFRATRTDVAGADAAGNGLRDRSVCLDVVLDPTIDTTLLADNLRSDRNRRARTVTWRHYPVTLHDRSTLRIEWRGKHARVVPSLEEAIRLLAPFGEHYDSRRERTDLGTPGIAPVNADPERAIRILAEQGRVIDATVLAVRAFGMTQSQARTYIDELVAGRPRQR